MSASEKVSNKKAKEDTDVEKAHFNPDSRIHSFYLENVGRLYLSRILRRSGAVWGEAAAGFRMLGISKEE